MSGGRESGRPTRRESSEGPPSEAKSPRPRCTWDPCSVEGLRGSVRQNPAEWHLDMGWRGATEVAFTSELTVAQALRGKVLRIRPPTHESKIGDGQPLLNKTIF